MSKDEKPCQPRSFVPGTWVQGGVDRPDPLRTTDPLVMQVCQHMTVTTTETWYTILGALQGLVKYLPTDIRKIIKNN